MSSPDALLELTEVTKNFESAGNEPIQVLNRVNLQVQKGKSLAIIGPSGSGKSTLLNLIGTLDRPSSGRILLDGIDLSSLEEPGLAQIRNRRIGFIFQAHYLLPQCTVLENVLLPTLATKDPAIRKGAEERARRLLNRVGLGDRISHRPGQLSGGECQRVAVVRALINGPELLLGDEPTGALDRGSSRNLAQLLIELNREEGVTLILVTHSLDLARQMETVMELRDGTLVKIE